MTAAALALLLIGVACAALMGFAIQRGATCMVAAIDEIVSKRTAWRLVAFLEASLIVAGGIAVAVFFGILKMEPATFPLTGWTLLGGAALGLGAFVTRACVFGAIARLGSGDWAYALVPAGFFLGCLAVQPALGSMAPMPIPSRSLLITAAPIFAAPLVLAGTWRVWLSLEALRSRRFREYVWAPHVATGVIGLTFVIMLIAVGPWAYTQLLADLASGMPRNILSRLLLLAALFTGALTGGWTAGRLRRVRPNAASVARCLAGGALMGAGSALVPGSNDGLILIGLPLLRLHAWVALATMAITIYLALKIDGRARAMAGKLKLA